MKTIVNKKKTVKNSSKTLGPVNNLEQHLRNDWWKRIFNSMYLKTDADVVDDKKITETEVELFCKILNIEKNNAVLDLACGQGRHVIELARRGFKNLNGLDRSRFLIQKAKSTISNENLVVNFREGDARKLPYQTDNFDFVTILGNSFGYFESTDDDVKILNEVYRVLKPNGIFLIDLADGEFLKENFSPRSWEWIDKKHFVCRERSLARDNERLISREVVTNIQKGVIVDQFYAERLYSKNGIRNLFEKIGFKNITFHGEISSDSQRNQDLGMMERRLIITAQVIKEWSPKKERKDFKDAKNIVVILGDPEKKDNIKPNSSFGEADFETINLLKIALSELTNYKFTFLTNHDTLVNDLQKLKSKIDFVFNLCDEGFNNEPSKELHVPAILEALRIPYTGSNPQCLAYCYDKSLVRGIAAEMGIPIANGFFIKPGDNIFNMNLSFPVIAKPNFGDASFGITQQNVAYNIEELNNAILKIRHEFGYEKPILVEEFLTGAEFTVGIIGNLPGNYTVLPILEEDFSDLPADLPRICGYEAKWISDSPYFNLLKSVPANLPKELEQEVINCSIKLFDRLGISDYARFDWRLDAEGNHKLLEVNPNPGWCWDGHLAKMANLADINYPAMLNEILTSAQNRIFANEDKNL